MEDDEEIDLCDLSIVLEYNGNGIPHYFQLS